MCWPYSQSAFYLWTIIGIKATLSNFNEYLNAFNTIARKTVEDTEALRSSLNAHLPIRYTYPGNTSRGSHAGQMSESFEVSIGICCHQSSSSWLLTASWGLPHQAGTMVYRGHSWHNSAISILQMTWLVFPTTTGRCREKNHLATTSAGMEFKHGVELIAQDMTWHDAAKTAQNLVYWRTVVDSLCFEGTTF